VFAGNFTLDAAAAVVADEVTNASDVICCVANLVSKSLISAETKIGRPRYRLLDTTRAYSRQKLKECNEFGEFARRHAEYYRDLFERASLECVTQNAADWLLVYGEQIDNVRAALNWAFSAEGSASTGVALTIAVVPLWLNLSLMDECLQRVKKALSRLDSDHLQAPMCEMQLYTALGVALYLIGPGPETKAAWKQVQTIAESLANTDYRLRALWGLWTVCVTGGEHRNGLSLANEFTKLAEEASDSEALLVGDRLIGTSHHFLGKQEAARRHIERMLDRSTSVSDPSEIIRFQCNQSIAARSYLAKVLWLQGYPEQALAAVEHTISDARAISHSHSLCYALASGACPITFFVGDLLVAERYVTMLLDDAVTHRLALWTKMGRGFKGTLLIRRGDLSAGVQLLRAATDELQQAGYVLYRTAFLAELAQGLANGGEISTGLTTISEALAQAIRNNELWFMPELLRVKGEIALLESASGVETVAEECFAESLDLARQQKALSWELRSALSLARFRRTQNRTREARSLLGAVYSTFGEGFETADLKSAKQMLDELN
jgi:predicted ATPase